MRLKIKRVLKGSACFLGCLLAAAASMAADVDVYAEGAVKGSRLKVYIYADLNINNLLSYGISLNYDAEELSVLDVQKRPEPVPYTSNQAKWSSGQRTEVYVKNLEPEYALPGEIIILGGKTEADNPTQTVPQGSRALLAVVTFGPANIVFPSNPTLFLSYARGGGAGPPRHFRQMKNGSPQAVNDTDICFGTVSVAEQGDADRDGRITLKDINCIELNLENANAPCYMDCDGDGLISLKDISCVKSKL